VEPSRKKRIHELYSKIDELDRSLAKAGSKSERVGIRRRLIMLRNEVGRILEPEPNEQEPKIVLSPGEQSHKTKATSQKSLRDLPNKYSGTIGPRQNTNSQKNLQKSSRSETNKPGRDKGGTVKSPIPRINAGSTDYRVSKVAARDYIYKRLDELTKIILSGTDTEREQARKERAFLEKQFKIVRSTVGQKVRLDSALARLVRETSSKPPHLNPDAALNSRPGKTSKKTPKQAPSASVKQPPYVNKCEKMDFRELRQFIDDSLRELSVPRLNKECPRTKKEFLNLWEILCRKIDTVALPAIIPAPAKPDFPPFAPSQLAF